MRIFVAGGAGYIGSCTTEYLLDKGHEVAVYDSLTRGHRAAVDNRAKFYHGDLEDMEFLTKTMRDFHPEYVLHFAAFIEVGESMKDPGMFFHNNVGNANNVNGVAGSNTFIESLSDPATFADNRTQNGKTCTTVCL